MEKPTILKPTRKFCCQYYHDGGWWSCIIDAYDMEDAKVRADRLSMKLDGEYVMTVPAGAGLVAGLVCAVRNLFRIPTKQ